jgi:hypothetical protein
MLFSDRSVLTMVHGMLFGGGTLLALAALLYALVLVPGGSGGETAPEQARSISRLMILTAVLLWMAVLGGTYIVFPPYRATPPEGLVELAAYPRSFLLSNPGTAWLHAIAMEMKEHVPWIAAMLATASAFVGVRYRSSFLTDSKLRRLLATSLGISFVLVAVMATLGVFINKVAPLE